MGINKGCWWLARQFLCLSVRLPYKRSWSKPRKALRALETVTWELGYWGFRQSTKELRHVR